MTFEALEMAATPMCTAGSKVTRERGGVCVIELTYAVAGPREDGGDEPYETLLTWAPAKGPMNLPAVDRNSTKEDNGDWLMTIRFEGMIDDKQYPTIIELDHASSEEPIETFPKFDLLKAKYKGTLSEGDRGTVSWPQMLPQKNFQLGARDREGKNASDRILNPIFGQSQYLTANACLRITFTQRKFDHTFLYNICKVDDALVPKEDGAGKELLIKDPDQQWLKRSVKASFRGNCWEFTIDWLLGKWNPDIYNVVSPRGQSIREGGRTSVGAA